MNAQIRYACLLATLLLLSAGGRLAAEHPFDEIIVFGASFSDTGNVFLQSRGLYAGPPYYGGRFSNGPVWVERLAERLHLGHSTQSNPVPGPSLAGGTNYAYGGAQAGPGYSATACAFIDGTRTCVPNLGLQIEQFFADGRTLDGDELIVVQGGGNNESAEFAAVQTAQHVATLAAAGGEIFLVPNAHRISQAPGVVYDDRRWDQFVTDFNATLEQQLDALEASTDITIARMDSLGLHDAIVNSPSSYGLTNVTDPACPECRAVTDPNAADTIVPNPHEYLWWDGVHFTAVANQIFGDAAAELVQTTVFARDGATAIPEPSTLALAELTAVGLVFGVRRRLRRA